MLSKMIIANHKEINREIQNVDKDNKLTLTKLIECQSLQIYKSLFFNESLVVSQSIQQSIMLEALNIILIFEQEEQSDFTISIAQQAFEVFLYYFGPLQPDFIFNNKQLNDLFKKQELLTKFNDSYPKNIYFVGTNQEDIWCIQTKIAFHFSSLRRKVSMLWSTEWNPMISQFTI